MSKLKIPDLKEEEEEEEEEEDMPNLDKFPRLVC